MGCEDHPEFVDDAAGSGGVQLADFQPPRVVVCDYEEVFPL